MLSSLYRQRRRILTCATLLTFTVLVGTMTSDVYLSHLPMWVMPTATALFFCASAVTIAVLVLLFPAIRTLWEVVALFTFLEALFIWVAPEVNAALSNTYLRFAISAAVIALIYLALYGRLLDRVPALFSFAARQTVEIRATSNAVWNAVVPQQANKHHYWAGHRFDIIPDPDETDTVHLRTPIAPNKYISQSVTFVARQRPNRCRYYFTSDGAGSDFAEGIYDFKITPRGQGVVLEIALFRTGTRLREMLRMWLDDALGEQADAVKARLEGTTSYTVGDKGWRRSGELV